MLDTPLTEAKQRLVKRYMPLARKIAAHFYRKMYAVQNYFETPKTEQLYRSFSSKDIYQEAYLGLIQAATTYNNGHRIKFVTYAYTVIQNFVRAKINKMKSLNLIVSFDLPENSEERLPREEEEIPGKEIFNKELFKVCLDKLPKLEKEMVLLRLGLFDNKVHSVVEISRKMKLPVHIVYTTLRQIRKIKIDEPQIMQKVQPRAPVRIKIPTPVLPKVMPCIQPLDGNCW